MQFSIFEMPESSRTRLQASLRWLSIIQSQTVEKWETFVFPQTKKKLHRLCFSMKCDALCTSNLFCFVIFEMTKFRYSHEWIDLCYETNKYRNLDSLQVQRTYIDYRHFLMDEKSRIKSVVLKALSLCLCVRQQLLLLILRRNSKIAAQAISRIALHSSNKCLTVNANYDMWQTISI